MRVDGRQPKRALRDTLVTVSDTVRYPNVRGFRGCHDTFVRVSGTGAGCRDACENDRGQGDAHSA
jgi:hypothetical protein